MDMKKYTRLLALVPHAGLAVCAAVWASAAWTDSPAQPALAKTHYDSDLKWGPCPPFLPKGCGIAVLHGDPAKPNLDVFFKVPAGSKIAPHTHTSAERMVLVSGRLDVKYAGQPAATLQPGSYAYGPAGRPHEASCHAGQDCVLFIAFESPLDALQFTGEVK
jgi:quercetin dioxygenase-like cupin family protein